MTRPPASAFTGKPVTNVPMSLQRVAQAATFGERVWIGPEDAAKLSVDDKKQHELAHQILCHLAVQAPANHASGHPGGPLSAFTFAYALSKRRDPAVDQPLRYSAGHLSILAYGLQWLFGREGSDERLKNPDAIIAHFRTPSGLPGHVEAGIGDIPFGTGPLGKGVSHGLGTAFALKHLKQTGMVDVLLADGDCQEGQVAEALRLAAHLQLGNLIVHLDLNDVQLSGMPSKVVAADVAAIAFACGWHVIEVQNGNDIAQVTAAQERADTLGGKDRPVMVVYYTTMGHGIPLMEDGSNTGTTNWHGTPMKPEQAEEALKHLPALAELVTQYTPFHDAERKRYTAKKPVVTDLLLDWKSPGKRSITTEKGSARKDFGATHLKALMDADERIVVLHADLAASGGFDAVEKAFPDRVINVGVAEANMYMMAAGMRQGGLLPVTYTFAAFGTNEARANARLIDINCSHTRCGVIHDCTHSGISVGEDGETHQEQNYLALPYRHTQVWTPVDSNQAAAMADAAMKIIAEGHQSVYVFSGREGHPQLADSAGAPLYGENYVFDGRMTMVRGHGDTTDQVTIFGLGAAVHDILAAVDSLARQPDVPQNFSPRVMAVGCVRPLDAAAVMQAALETRHLIVVEDHNTEGGLASQIADIVASFQLPCSLTRLGLKQFFSSATAKDLKLMAGIDADSIADAILDAVRSEVCGGEDAFVTAVYRLIDNLPHSRFAAMALPFLQQLEDEEYLDEIRGYWRSNTCPPEKLPDNDDLLKRIGQIVKN